MAEPGNAYAWNGLFVLSSKGQKPGEKRTAFRWACNPKTQESVWGNP